MEPSQHRHCHPPTAAELKAGSDCETLVSTAAPSTGLGLDVPTPWFTPLHPSQVSALLARAEKVKQGGEEALAHLKSPQRGPGIPPLHPSSLCYAISFPEIQTVFIKEWHALKMI